MYTLNLTPPPVVGTDTRADAIYVLPAVAELLRRFLSVVNTIL